MIDYSPPQTLQFHNQSSVFCVPSKRQQCCREPYTPLTVQPLNEIEEKKKKRDETAMLRLKLTLQGGTEGVGGGV